MKANSNTNTLAECQHKPAHDLEAAAADAPLSSELKAAAFQDGLNWGKETLARVTRDRYKTALAVMPACDCTPPFATYWAQFCEGATAALGA